MNTGYLIYQAERTRSAAEQREVDVYHAELAASFARLWQFVAGPRRSRPGATTGQPTAPARAPGGAGAGWLGTGSAWGHRTAHESRPSPRLLIPEGGRNTTVVRINS